MYPYIFIGNKSISTYGLCMVVGIILVFFLSYRYASKLKVNLYDMIITATAAVGSGLLGASVLYILVSYSVEEIINQIKSGNLQFLNGGLVYYGSLIGGIIGSLIAIKATKASLYDIEDSIIPYLPLGHAIGRIGCIMAGCCHGFEYNGLLAFHYSNSILGLSPEQGYFPIQLLEAVINTLIVFCLLWYRKRKHHKGELVASYLLLYSTARFFIEFLRGDEVRGHYLSVSTSQWISVVLFVSSLIYFAIVFLREMQNKKKLTN